MFGTLRQIFSKIKYLTTAVLVSVVVFAFSVWLPNLKLIVQIILNSSVSFLDKINFLFSLFGSIKTNFTIVSASYTITIAVLFGMNIAILAYYIRSRQTKSLSSGATLSIGGLVSGIFGIGCAACGTFLLTSILALFGATGFLAILPFGGEEFGFLGVGLLAYSSYLILNKIEEPLVCEL